MQGIEGVGERCGAELPAAGPTPSSKLDAHPGDADTHATLCPIAPPKTTQNHPKPHARTRTPSVSLLVTHAQAARTLEHDHIDAPARVADVRVEVPQLLIVRELVHAQPVGGMVGQE